LLALAPFLVRGRGHPPGQPEGGGAEPRPTVADEPEQVEGVRLTYGRNGPPRPDKYVLPGEHVEMECVVRGAGKKPTREVDLALAGELVDHNGKKVRELLPIPFKVPLDKGGSTLVSSFTFALDDKQAPGGYQLRGRMSDYVTGRVANFEHPLIVRRP